MPVSLSLSPTLVVKVTWTDFSVAFASAISILPCGLVARSKTLCRSDSATGTMRRESGTAEKAQVARILQWGCNRARSLRKDWGRHGGGAERPASGLPGPLPLAAGP